MVNPFSIEEGRKDALFSRAIEKNAYLLENKSWAFWDLETTNLNASIGRVLCGTVYTEPSRYDTFSNWKDDRRTCVKIRDRLEQFDYAVSYNGLRFDLPYLNTRLLKHGERPLKPLRHVDLIWTARSALRLHSNRLQVVGQTMLGVSGKTNLDGDIWGAASVGDKAALAYIIEHCEADCLELAKIFAILKDFRNLAATPLRGAYIG